MTRRLLLINPNTTADVTDRLRSHVESVLGDGWSVTPVTAPFGEPYIVDEVGYAIAAHATIDAYRADRARHGEADAVLVGCFGDPGVFALRSLTDRPVIGLAEAAIREADAAGPWVVVTGGVHWPAMLARFVVSIGMPHPGERIIALRPDGAQMARDPDASFTLLKSQCSDALRRHAPAAIVVGGAGLAGIAGRIATDLGLAYTAPPSEVSSPTSGIARVIDSVHAGARALRRR